jgi:hypothetical protein
MKNELFLLKWEDWAKQQLTTHSSSHHPHQTFAHTSGPIHLFWYVSSLMLPTFLPTIQKAAGSASKAAANYVVERSLSHITGTNWGSQASTTLLNNLLSIPAKAFASSTSNNETQDPKHTLQTINKLIHHNNNQQKQTEVQQQESINNIKAQHWALALGAIATLFFEFLGMQEMIHELPRMKHVVSSQSNTLIHHCKKLLSDRYEQAPYYLNQANNSFFDPQHSDPVRLIYNILIGLNHTFFYMIGSKSSDSTAEVIHWGAIWFYWEVLAQLVHLYGLSPVTIAYKQFFEYLLKSYHQPTSTS